MSAARIADVGREVREEDIEIVAAQAPAHATREQIVAALYAAAHDIAGAVAALWDARPIAVGTVRDEQQRKWDEIRERCDDISRGRLQALAQRRAAQDAPTADSAAGGAALA